MICLGKTIRRVTLLWCAIGYVGVVSGVEDQPAAGSQATHPRPTKRIYPGGSVDKLAFSPDGKILAVGGGPDFVSLYEATNGTAITELQLFDEDENAILSVAEHVPVLRVLALAFSPDSSLLAVGHSCGQVKLFDTRTGEFKLSLDDVNREAEGDKPLHEFFKLRLAQGVILNLAFSPDGRLLATCGKTIDYARDGRRRLGAGPDSGLLKLWDAKSGELKHDLKGEHNQTVTDVAFSVDGSLLASAGQWRNNDGAGSGIKLWDPTSGQVTKVLMIPNSRLTSGSAHSVRFSPDGKRLAMGAYQHNNSTDVTSGSVSIYDPATGILGLSWRVPIPVRQVEFSHDGKLIAARCDSNAITLFNSTTGQPKQELRPFGNPAGVRWDTFACSPTGHRLAVGGSDAKGRGFVELWNVD